MLGALSSGVALLLPLDRSVRRTHLEQPLTKRLQIEGRVFRLAKAFEDACAAAAEEDGVAA